MATMKPLNFISSEPLNANREVKTPVLIESDGQAFAQTLRQQMQGGNSNSQSESESRLEAQANIAQKQTERARINQQNNQAKAEKSAKSAMTDLAKKSAQEPTTEEMKTSLLSEQVSAVFNKKTLSKTSDLITEPANLQSAIEAHAGLQSASELTELEAKQVEMKDDETQQFGSDENAIANMGWLASMMAMRDNQQVQSNPVSTIDTEKTISSDNLTSDTSVLKAQMALAENVSDKPSVSATQQEDMPNIQDLGKANNQPDLAKDGLMDASQDLAAMTFKENLANQTVDKPLLQASRQLDNAIANEQALLNTQATANFNTANAPITHAAQVMTAQVTVAFGIKGWQEAMNNQVMRMTQQGNELATLTLSPPDLGPVQVVLRVDNQSVDTAFISDNANVRQALEDGLQDLKERMASQGLQLGNTFVGNGNQAQQHFESQARPSSTPLTALNPNTKQDTVVAPVRTLPIGLVDTFV